MILSITSTRVISLEGIDGKDVGVVAVVVCFVPASKTICFCTVSVSAFGT